jgi:prephenate dehydrogenase
VSTVAVLGLGLIGGSLARALAVRGDTVLGYDRSPDVSLRAIEAGIVTYDVADDLGGLEEAESVVLAVPVSDASALLKRAAPRLKTTRLITDVGSTKRSICATAREHGLGSRFVGSHPYAGDHRSGWDAGRADLFVNATVFVCTLPETTPETLKHAHDLWSGIGAVVEEIGIEEHDRRLAWTSHLPQLVASLTAAVLDKQEIGRSALGSGGRDVTRLAGSSTELWSAIALDNADNLGLALGTLQTELSRLQSALALQDERTIHELLERASRWFNQGG